MTTLTRVLLPSLITALALTTATPAARADSWPAEKANAWYKARAWPVGCNFNPSTAINQLEMWQAATFDLRDLADVTLRIPMSGQASSLNVAVAHGIVLHRLMT